MNRDNLKDGLLRILWGLFKIIVISERAGIFVDAVYTNLTIYNGYFVIGAALLFVIQLYTNFSGLIDIIMGISKTLGIDLPENFKTPFFSRTITEFWRNWHITLGSWLRDYIFYPLLKSNFMQFLNKKCKSIFGKKVGKKVPLYLSMLIMWILIGIWHGGAYTYIIGCGLLQFLFIFLEDVLEPISISITKKLGINRESIFYKFYQILRTFFLFSFSMIFFRALSISDAVDIVKSIFIWDFTSNIFDIMSLSNYIVLFVSIVFMFIIEYLKYKDVDLSFKNRHRDYILLIIFIFIIILFGTYGIGFDKADFIYNKF